MILPVLIAAFAVLGVILAVALIRDYQKHKNQLEPNSWTKTGLIGFISNFLDTLGIGSFATETAMFKFFRQSEDRVIPGTLNVANAIPTIAQAIIYTQIVEVEPLTLVLMLLSAVAGSVLGAGIVAKLPEKKIQLTMGFALFVTAGFLVAKALGYMETTGEVIGLEGKMLAIGVGANFVLGALMTAGIGLYAPCMALVAMLGMSAKTAFPIMMGSCAMLMPVAGLKFIKEGAYNRRASFAIAITGVFGVLIAAYIVKSLPMEYLRWLVVLVVIYTSVVMLRSALQPKAIK
ncbi:MAG: sulfite exporter TauE/SafE family protein [Bacteroidetes bacterium]|nr:sulfite exporter TauE/SafE family protein [Bacteroidota bacterium]